MKNLYLVCFVAVLAGCATARFDNVELSLATDIRYLSKQTALCDNPDHAAVLAQKLQEKGSYFAMYVEHTPNNVETVKMVNELVQDIEGMSKSYTSDKRPGTAYCKNKLEIINHSSDIVQKSMAIKLRK
jgi:hypothetical protein